ncbi:hypothetical protein ILYODFUR_037887 [Ilyodon furcidens]|uniref:Uncharacterized protein n=1 Tax=Ilyodon furcidens TaxID=33524 RepID=A0ABV0TSU0_9TELE
MMPLSRKVSQVNTESGQVQHWPVQELCEHWVTGKQEEWAGGGVHPGQVASPSQGNTQTTKHTLIHTPKGNLETN